MKRLHRDDLFGWSVFDESRNIDFHGVAWVRDGGNVLIDPVPTSAHDEAHLRELGGAATIVITNSDHVRDAGALAETFGARILGPRGEQDRFPIRCDGWLGDGEAVVPGLIALAVSGSKTPGELALVLEGSTLVTGDLIRAHEGGRLCLLPDAKLADPGAARSSARRLAALPGIDAVLVGDGWPVFRHGGDTLRELAGTFGDC